MQDNFIESYNILSKEYCEKAIGAFEEAAKHSLCQTRQEANGHSKNLMDDSSLHLPMFEHPLAHSSPEVSQGAQDAILKATEQYYEKYSA